jgi:hypothetical protein
MATKKSIVITSKLDMSAYTDEYVDALFNLLRVTAQEQHMPGKNETVELITEETEETDQETSDRILSLSLLRGDFSSYNPVAQENQISEEPSNGTEEE